MSLITSERRSYPEEIDSRPFLPQSNNDNSSPCSRRIQRRIERILISSTFKCDVDSSSARELPNFLYDVDFDRIQNGICSTRTSDLCSDGGWFRNED